MILVLLNYYSLNYGCRERTTSERFLKIDVFKLTLLFSVSHPSSKSQSYSGLCFDYITAYPDHVPCRVLLAHLPCSLER